MIRVADIKDLLRVCLAFLAILLGGCGGSLKIGGATGVAPPTAASSTPCAWDISAWDQSDWAE